MVKIYKLNISPYVLSFAVNRSFSMRRRSSYILLSPFFRSKIILPTIVIFKIFWCSIMTFFTIIQQLSQITMSIVQFDWLKFDFMSLFHGVFESIRTTSWFLCFLLLFFGKVIDPFHLYEKMSTFPWWCCYICACFSACLLWESLSSSGLSLVDFTLLLSPLRREGIFSSSLGFSSLLLLTLCNLS